MKAAYPVILTPGDQFVLAYVPDFDINTQGVNQADAMEMARDAIGMVGMDMEDDHEVIPDASPIQSVAVPDDGFVTLVDVDFQEYRRRHEQRAVRRNVTLPAWLDAAANDAGLNVSAVLQAALKSVLGKQSA